MRLTPVVEERKRNRTSTRVGCTFSICYSVIDYKSKESKTNKRVKITKASNYQHSNGCLPSREQLAMETRKTGSFPVAIHETRIKTILAAVSTNVKVSTPLLRGLMQPMFPPGTALDSQFIFNFRDQEDELLSCIDVAHQETPEYVTAALECYQELLQEAMKDKNDLQQITTFLDSCAAKDPTFTYSIGTSDDGEVTGILWQTGVMRKDFQLFGDALFIDCLGRSLNDKGWPINTIAMLDGQKKVCLPCEAITIKESIDAYAWLIRSAVEMTPGREVSDIKIIFGDGILDGDTLLKKLGITQTCIIVLDQYHLLDPKIGAWPKNFGLRCWNLVQDDLTKMVKETSEGAYNQALNRLRDTVKHSADLSTYVEKHIHGKRRQFAMHLVSTYPGNSERHGNAPAEANHSSILRRIGSEVVHPANLVGKLFQRHCEISHERNMKLAQYNAQALGSALKVRDLSDQEARKSLSSWGLELYERSKKYSHNMTYNENSNGSITFLRRDGTEYLTLSSTATSCCCKNWIAYAGIQCAHLYVARNKKFDIGLWKPHFRIRKKLDVASPPSGQHQSTSCGYVPSVDGDGPEWFPPGEDDEQNGSQSENDMHEVNGNNQDMHKVNGNNQEKLNYGLNDMQRVAQQVVYDIFKCRHQKTRHMFAGTLLQLHEHVLGNETTA
ncbi:hypothetical protein IV203_034210 [Nitzschia inconspicua]|uniref:SWIM-type domain-containing protein n=1 Tax=Nitzschia inconspicua TaxID=303405 RepID=A0A9K3M7F6_9STRA|nr:hypothetical protein IV203_034210 [Nitzschia inconspicua]